MEMFSYVFSVKLSEIEKIKIAKMKTSTFKRYYLVKQTVQ